MLVRFTVIICLLRFLDKNAAQSANKSLEKVKQSRIKPKIVGGTPAKLGEIPYQVSLKKPVFANKIYASFCGACIIKPKVILSAGHCFIDYEAEKFFLTSCNGRIPLRHYRTTYAVAGNLKNKAINSNQPAAGQWRRLSIIAIPSDYTMKEGSTGHDIAVVHLTQPFIFNKYVGPINYARNFMDYTGLPCVASGYGLISTDPNRPVVAEELRKADLHVMSPKQCEDVMQKKNVAGIICTIVKDTSINSGDSGGPFFCKKVDTDNPEKAVLVGICSGGNIQLSVFTRTSAVAKYIERGKADKNISLNKLQYLVFFIIWIIM